MRAFNSASTPNLLASNLPKDKHEGFEGEMKLEIGWGLKVEEKRDKELEQRIKVEVSETAGYQAVMNFEPNGLWRTRLRSFSSVMFRP